MGMVVARRTGDPVALLEKSKKWIEEHGPELDAIDRAAQDQQAWREMRSREDYPPTYEEYMGLEEAPDTVKALRADLEGRIRRSKMPTDHGHRVISLDQALAHEESLGVQRL